MVAAGQVGSTNRPRKQRVADKEILARVALFSNLKAHPSRAVSGCVMHPDLVVAERDDLPWRVEHIDGGERIHVQPEHRPLLHGALVEEHVVAVQVNGDAQGLLRSGDAGHMIDVGMSQKNVANGQGPLLRERQQALYLVARVNQHRLPGTFAADDEAILEKRSHGLCLNYHGRTRMILAIVDDLMFTSKIRTTATQLGVPLSFARSSEGALAEMRKQRPALVIFDLNSTRSAPLTTIAAMKSDPALADIPSLGFVSHVQTDLIDAARQAGVDEVVARSAFTMRLPEILARGK
jgi:CheY-like chemotaxis protein